MAQQLCRHCATPVDTNHPDMALVGWPRESPPLCWNLLQPYSWPSPVAPATFLSPVWPGLRWRWKCLSLAWSRLSWNSLLSTLFTIAPAARSLPTEYDTLTQDTTMTAPLDTDVLEALLALRPLSGPVSLSAAKQLSTPPPHGAHCCPNPHSLSALAHDPHQSPSEWKQLWSYDLAAASPETVRKFRPNGLTIVRHSPPPCTVSILGPRQTLRLDPRSRAAAPLAWSMRSIWSSPGPCPWCSTQWPPSSHCRGKAARCLTTPAGTLPAGITRWLCPCPTLPPDPGLTATVFSCFIAC